MHVEFHRLWCSGGKLWRFAGRPNRANSCIDSSFTFKHYGASCQSLTHSWGFIAKVFSSESEIGNFFPELELFSSVLL